MMATQYQRLDYRDYSSSTLLSGIESGIRANWRAMQEERRALNSLGGGPLDKWNSHHRRMAWLHKSVLCELLDIRRQAR